MQVNKAKVRMLHNVSLLSTDLFLTQGHIYDATRATNQPDYMERGLWFVHDPKCECTEDSILCSTVDGEIIFDVSPSMQGWAQRAIEVQNACNLSGVLYSMSEALKDIKEEYKLGWSTDDYSRHPIMVLFANKVLSMTGQWSSPEDESFSIAWKRCRQLESGVAIEWLGVFTNNA